jgi:succinate dehydrogenase (ubiquinone) cytochrome b560 subunit
VFYGFSIAYLVGPGTLSTTQIVEVVSSLPESIKYTGKAILAAPFAFHSFNGLRHLSWDLTKCMVLLSNFLSSRLTCPIVLSLKGVYRSGYSVLGATVVTTLYLTFFQ